MREIKFRGIVSDDCEFGGETLFTKGQVVKGHLIRDGLGQPFIMGDMIEVDNEMTIFETWISVDQSSVGQFTGLKDKNFKDIYEGDLMECNYCKKEYGEVYWNKSGADFRIKWKDDCCANARLTRIDNWSTVAGNVHENPDFLSTSQE